MQVVSLSLTSYTPMSEGLSHISSLLLYLYICFSLEQWLGLHDQTVSFRDLLLEIELICKQFVKIDHILIHEHSCNYISKVFIKKCMDLCVDCITHKCHFILGFNVLLRIVLR